jgi:hypothetical protein
MVKQKKCYIEMDRRRKWDPSEVKTDLIGVNGDRGEKYPRLFILFWYHESTLKVGELTLTIIYAVEP